MKTYIPFLVLTLTMDLIRAAPFRNLGFDDATTNSTILSTYQYPGLAAPQGMGPTVDLLPGWQLSYAGANLTTMGYNVYSPDAHYATLMQPVAGTFLER